MRIGGHSGKGGRKVGIFFRATCCLHGAHQGLEILNSDIPSTHLKLSALDYEISNKATSGPWCFTRAVRALETTNQLQQSDLCRETFFPLTANLNLQWIMATGCMLCLWRNDAGRRVSLLSQRFRAHQALTSRLQDSL